MTIADANTSKSAEFISPFETSFIAKLIRTGKIKSSPRIMSAFINLIMYSFFAILKVFLNSFQIHKNILPFVFYEKEDTLFSNI